jgi:hypothetical protein
MNRLVFVVVLLLSCGAAAHTPNLGPLSPVHADCLTLESEFAMDVGRASHNVALAREIIQETKGVDLCGLGVRVVAVVALSWDGTLGAYEPGARTVYVNRMMSSLVHEYLHVIDLDAGHWETTAHQYNGAPFLDVYGPALDRYIVSRFTNLAAEGN